MNLTRGMLRCCDSSKSATNPALLNRLHLENNIVRQFLERGEKLVRFYLPLAQILTDTRPLAPYANVDVVKSTVEIDVPDIFPMDPLAALWPTNVYNEQSNFPLKVTRQLESIREHKNNFGVGVRDCFSLYEPIYLTDFIKSSFFTK